ncbi:MAG: hypothetical protein IKS55_04795 [Oscillospiraceae bacterium]|nr:hypothetical protein [Oscillospiraceae bacterium]
MKKNRKSAAILLAIATLMLAAALSGCGGSREDPNAPPILEIHDSIADVEDIGDGKAMLFMDGQITNTSKMKTVEYASLPYLTMDGQEIETTCEILGRDDNGKVGPRETVVYSVRFEFDPGTEHEWKFGTREGTVVNGLGDYACVKAALRNFEGKAPVTKEDLQRVEAEQKQKYQEFLKENKGQSK